MDTQKRFSPPVERPDEVKLLTETIGLMIKQMVQLVLELKKSRLPPEQIIRREWMTGAEVEQAMRISTRSLQTLRDKGDLPFTHIENKYYYKPADVRQLLERGYGRKMVKKEVKGIKDKRF